MSRRRSSEHLDGDELYGRRRRKYAGSSGFCECRRLFVFYCPLYSIRFLCRCDEPTPNGPPHSMSFGSRCTKRQKGRTGCRECLHHLPRKCSAGGGCSVYASFVLSRVRANHVLCAVVVFLHVGGLRQMPATLHGHDAHLFGRVDRSMVSSNY